jgi:hypothetical protein
MQRLSGRKRHPPPTPKAMCPPPPPTHPHTCDAVCHEPRQVLLADGLAAGQVAVTKHDVRLALLHQLHLPGQALEEGGGPHNAVADVASSLAGRGARAVQNMTDSQTARQAARQAKGCGYEAAEGHCWSCMLLRRLCPGRRLGEQGAAVTFMRSSK